MQRMTKFLIFFALALFLIPMLTFSGKKEYPLSTWLWDTDQIRIAPDEMMLFLKEQRVTVLYLQVNKDIDINIYRSFIKKANNHGIQIHALGGAPNWINSHHQAHYKEWLQWITDYQDYCIDSSEMFTGIHLDVEPYLLPGWKQTNSDWIEDYQHLLSHTSAFSKQLGLSFGVDIPFWWDELSFANQYGKGHLARWIIKNTDFVTVMAYRNYAKGPNGIIELTASELNWAEQLNKPVIIAVETLPQAEDHTSFFYTDMEQMQKQLNLFIDHYRQTPSFHGLAIHDLSGWMRMLDKNRSR